MISFSLVPIDRYIFKILWTNFRGHPQDKSILFYVGGVVRGSEVGEVGVEKDEKEEGVGPVETRSV